MVGWISQEVADGLKGSVLNMATLCEFRFASGTMYVWNGSGSRTIAGRDYIGLGTIGGIEGLAQTRAPTSEKVVAKLACLTPEVAALAASENAEVRGRLAFISLQLFTSGWGVVGTPIPLFWGTMQRIQIVREPASEESGGSRIAELEIENCFAARSRPSNGLYTDAHQKAKHPGDNACKWVPKQKNQVITWPDL